MLDTRCLLGITGYYTASAYSSDPCVLPLRSRIAAATWDCGRLIENVNLCVAAGNALNNSATQSSRTPAYILPCSCAVWSCGSCSSYNSLVCSQPMRRVLMPRILQRLQRVNNLLLVLWIPVVAGVLNYESGTATHWLEWPGGLWREVR